VTKEAETGNVGAGICAAHFTDCFFAVFVQSCHAGGQQFGGWFIQQAAFESGVQNTNAQRLGQYQQVAFLAAAVWQNISWIHEAGNTKTEFWFRVFDGVAAGNNCACFRNFAVAALQDFAHHFDWQTGREANQIHCDGRVTAHSVDIAEGVGSGNLTEEIWVVNHWREEVNSLYNTKVITEFINQRIIGSIEADNQVWVIEFWKLSQNIGKDLRSDFGCSTCTLCHFCKAFAFSHVSPSSRRIYKIKLNFYVTICILIIKWNMKLD
jgi:hypothetical protein